MQYKDLTGQKFTRLLVVKDTGKRDSAGNAIWHCRCDCGNELDVLGRSLTTHNTQSCGCFNRERRTTPRKDLVDGTSVTAIKNNTMFSTNSTGYKGVAFSKRTGMYVAYIGFKGKRYHLGYYGTIEEAVHARKEAEARLYGDFLEWYNEQNSSK